MLRRRRHHRTAASPSPPQVRVVPHFFQRRALHPSLFSALAAQRCAAPAREPPTARPSRRSRGARARDASGDSTSRCGVRLNASEDVAFVTVCISDRLVITI